MSDIDPEELKVALRANMRQRMKKELANREPQTASRRWLQPLSWAAAILLVVSAAWYFWPAAGPDTEALYAENFEPLPNALSPGLRGDEERIGLDRALLLYEGRNYETALDLFNQLPAEELPAGAYLYRGICQMGLENWDAASDDFKRAESSIYRMSASWYAALNELGRGNLEAAKSALSIIAEQEGHPFGAQATGLLEQLQ